MKVKSYKRGIEEQNAYCQDCDWSCFDTQEGDVKSKARYHSQKTGHKVDVYTETRIIIKPLNSEK